MDVKIRRAGIEDLPWCLEVAERFWAEAKCEPLYGPYDRESASSILNRVVDSPEALVLVAESADRRVGLMIVGLTRLLINTSVVAQESVWWVEPELRHSDIGGDLMSEAMAWAAEHGATAMIAAAPRGDPKMGKMFLAHKFKLSEALYLRRL